MEEDKIFTVDDMLELCTKLSQGGYGNMPIKCQDVYLHKDEITTNFIGGGYMQFRGYMFHQDFTKKVKEFQNDFDAAVKKFYGYTD